MSRTELSGRCLCGAVQYRITGQPDDAFYCHCESCRRSSGAPFVAWGRVPQTRFELTQGALSKFASSPDVTRSRCTGCGTEILYQHKDCLPDLDFPLATLNNPEDVAPAYHVRTVEKLPWVQLGDGLPKYEAWRPKKDA
ncbi:GFA family protein [Pelagibius sp. Alg239-R121]|uniref:GFA family protein n=1 Tax=Pelagibius sp. Alg239-R121 TaxID=2993448 RepID=UPI0024A65C9D|nr:GFA family protein [Pelagibius sp. Alg239-R121]